MGTRIVWSKAWFRSRGVWGSLLAFAATLYGIYAVTLPCGLIQDLHNGLSSFLTLFGAFLAFIGRTTASQPIHFFWRYQAEVLDH